MELHKRIGTIHRTVTLLQTTLQQLQAEIPLSEVERIAILVHRGMSRRQRSFHTAEHIFDLADPDDPHGNLAALFHDLVYYQVDQGFEPEIGEILDPFIVIGDNGQISLATDLDPGQRAFYGCAAVFGFQPGDTLPLFGGLNEFLSALVMDRLFEGILADPDLLISTACIEATIPFRRPDETGRSPAERLQDRLHSTAVTMGLTVNEEDIQWAVLRAVTLANRDVSNFAEQDVARFLDNTWKLLPETNPELRVVGVYSISSYRRAVQKMAGFISALDPDCVFQQFAHTPPDAEFNRLRDLTRRNLDAAGTYLQIKFITASILEALAETTGGDAPVALFMGEIAVPDKDGHVPEQLADHLPEAPDTYNGTLDETLYHLLETGRASSVGFDLQNAPLSLFVYRWLGPKVLPATATAAAEMCAGTTGTTDFLASLPQPMVQAIARGAAQLVPTRREALLALG